MTSTGEADGVVIDSPPVFGFAVLNSNLDRVGKRAALTDKRTALVVTDEISAIVRNYPSTPESVDEKQPIVTTALVLVYDGRVDNRDEVAQLLERPELASAPDGAVLAAAYEKWGCALSAVVVGEYCFAVFDKKARMLVAGQDSLGVRKVFFGRIGDVLWASSSLGLLFRHLPRVRGSDDRDALREFFAGPMVPWSGRTIWSGVAQLKAGHALTQIGDGWQARRVWQPKRERVVFNSCAEVDEAFRERLFKAVRVSMRSPGPLLCDLSGGFDSSTICCVAASLAQSESGSKVIGWSLFSNRSNEQEFQDSVTKQYQLETHKLNLSEHGPFKVLTNTSLPGPGFIQAAQINMAARRFAAARGISCQLTGQGGDLLLQKGGGPPLYLADWLQEGRIRDWWSHCRPYFRSSKFNVWELLRSCTVATLDPHFGSRSASPSWITRAFQSELVAARSNYLSTTERAFRSDAREMVYRMLVNLIRYSEGAFPDQRMPLAYRPLVEFLLSLDWRFLMKPGADRVLLRRSMVGILPDRIRVGPACITSFGSEFYEAYRQSWPTIVRLTSGQHLADLGVVEPDAFRSMLSKMRAGYSGPGARMALSAMTLEIWLGMKDLRCTTD